MNKSNQNESTSSQSQEVQQEGDGIDREVVRNEGKEKRGIIETTHPKLITFPASKLFYSRDEEKFFLFVLTLSCLFIEKNVTRHSEERRKTK